MTLGSNIKKIRTEAQMSQEDFAELFDVSRQTISNWENEKSYPDLKTIVMLSDRFDVSLDVLLKEDMVMVEMFDNEMRSTRKYARGLLAVALVLALCIGGFGIYAGVYAHTKNTLESNFAAQLQAHDFYRNSEGYYSMAAGDGVVFSVPNQSMPGLLDFSLHFHVSNLYCTADRGEMYVDMVGAERTIFRRRLWRKAPTRWWAAPPILQRRISPIWTSWARRWAFQRKRWLRLSQKATPSIGISTARNKRTKEPLARCKRFFLYGCYSPILPPV